MTQRPKRCPTIELDQETLTSYTYQCSQPSFDRWTNLASVQMWDIAIIRFLLDEMLEFLNLPFAKDPTSTGDKECRWIMVEFDGCDFGLLDYVQPHDFPESEYCTPDDKLRLFSALSHRALNVFFNESPEILSGLLGVCHRDHFAADTLQIDQSERLSALQYKKLGDMIQRSVQLRELSIRLPLMDGAHELFAGLANAVEIEELSLADAKERNHLRDELGDQLVGGNGDIGPLLQLLQNPQNRLKKLSLSHMGLRDHHLSAILQMIPTSNIEDLDFSGNMIQVQGMLEFANMLPKMNALKRVVFRYNSWQDSPSADDDLDLNKDCRV